MYDIEREHEKRGENRFTCRNLYPLFFKFRVIPAPVLQRG
jgi:hypothetical protein